MPDSREVVDLPRIYLHHDLGSTSLDQEAKTQESTDPCTRLNRAVTQAMLRGRKLADHGQMPWCPSVQKGCSRRAPLGPGSCASAGAATGDERELGPGDVLEAEHKRDCQELSRP